MRGRQLDRAEPTEWTVLALRADDGDADRLVERLETALSLSGGEECDIDILRSADGRRDTVVVTLLGPAIMHAAALASVGAIRVHLEDALADVEQDIAEFIESYRETLGPVGVVRRGAVVSYLVGLSVPRRLRAWSPFAQTYADMASELQNIGRACLVSSRALEFTSRSSKRRSRDYGRDIAPRYAECMYFTGVIRQTRREGGQVIYMRCRLPRPPADRPLSSREKTRRDSAVRTFCDRFGPRVVEQYGTSARFEAARDGTIGRHGQIDVHYDLVIGVHADLSNAELNALADDLCTAWRTETAAWIGSPRSFTVNAAWAKPMQANCAAYVFKDRSRERGDRGQEFSLGDLYATLWAPGASQREQREALTRIEQLEARLGSSHKLAKTARRGEVLYYRNLTDLDYFLLRVEKRGGVLGDRPDDDPRLAEVGQSDDAGSGSKLVAGPRTAISRALTGVHLPSGVKGVHYPKEAPAPLMQTSQRVEMHFEVPLEVLARPPPTWSAGVD